jgi:hypothetical protein
MTYNWKKTLLKFGIVAGEVVIAGVFAYWADAPWLLAIAPLLEAIRNFLKHCKKKENGVQKKEEKIN